MLVGVLIAASAVAFLRAEHLKLERSPVAKPLIQKFFSATCMAGTRHCSPSHRAALSFTIRRPATVALAIVDGDGHVVRRLSGPVARPKGVIRTSWDGRTASGRLAPDGDYHLRVELRSLDRTITIPNPVVLDDTPPVITVRSPAGETPVRYRVSERARVWAVARVANYTGQRRRAAGLLPGPERGRQLQGWDEDPTGHADRPRPCCARPGRQLVDDRPGDRVAHARAVKDNPA